MRSLLARKLFIMCMGLCVLLILGACARQNTASLEDAIDYGIIMSFNTAIEDADPRRIVSARVDDLSSSVNLAVHLFFPEREVLDFSGEVGGGGLTVYVEWRQAVIEGDVLANFSYHNQRTEIDRAEAQRRLDQFTRETAIEAERRRAELADARNALNLAEAENSRPLSLRVAQLELGYERFRFTTDSTRDRLMRELADLNNILAGEYLVAPFDGRVFFQNFFQIFVGGGWSFMYWPPVIVQNEETLFFTLLLDEEFMSQRKAYAGAIAFGDVLTISSRYIDGSSPLPDFDVKVVTDPWHGGQRESLLFWLAPVDIDGLMDAVYALDPYDPMQTLNQMIFSTTVPVTLVDNGILLPTAAVNSEQGRRIDDVNMYVYVYEHGNLTKKYVTTGVRHRGYVHIVSGLEPGTRVVIIQ